MSSTMRSHSKWDINSTLHFTLCSVLGTTDVSFIVPIYVILTAMEIYLFRWIKSAKFYKDRLGQMSDR